MSDAKIYIIIRNDDLCSLSDPIKERRILEVFEKYNVPQVHSVVPNMVEDPHNDQLNQYHRLDENAEIVDLLKEYQAKGLVEIAQHGFTHQTNHFHPSKKMEIKENDYFQGIDRKCLAFSPANPQWYSEFNGLGSDEKEEKIVQGKSLLEAILGVKVNTFAFPWDSLDQECLEILDRSGFTTVLSDHNTYDSGGLNLLTCCYNDIFTSLDFVKEIESVEKPVLAHIEYHSWMLSDKDVQKLDDILGALSSNQRVQLIKASEIRQYIPEFQRIRKSKCKLDEIIGEANNFLNKELSIPRYVVLSRKYYKWKLLKAWILKFLVSTIGFKKALIISGVVLGAFIRFRLLSPYGHQLNFIDLCALICLSGVFAVTLFLNLKGVLYVQRAGH